MLAFTDRAREMVRSFLDQSEGELHALRISMHDGSPLAPRFELTLVRDDERASDDVEVDAGGLKVLVERDSAPRLEGATVDFVERVNESGFEIRPAPATPGDTVVEPPRGAIAEKVREILEQQINPAVAAHGGHIGLVDVKDTEVYIEMGGGCQGCALSRMTLRQGVERMIRQAVPEVTAIHDVTDHASGESPYFQQPA